MSHDSNRSRQSNSEGNESSPLLALNKIKSTPLPIKSIIILGLMRCSEPIALSCIFPFINQVSLPSFLPFPSEIKIYPLNSFLSFLSLSASPCLVPNFFPLIS